MTEGTSRHDRPDEDDSRYDPAPHPSPAEAPGDAVERPPRPSQPEGERDPDDADE